MKLQSKIMGYWAEFWARERPQHILWLPVLFGLGIGGYFLLPFEPSLNLLLALMCACIWLARRFRVLLLIAMALAGASTATFVTTQLLSPVLARDIRMTVVEGRITEIEIREKNARLVLDQVRLEKLPPDKTPHLVTLSLRDKTMADALELGDSIRTTAGFFPPPLPAIPGGFQFNRHFFFKEIGGMGYSIGKTPPEVTAHATDAGGVMGWVAAKRLELFRRLVAELGEVYGSVAAALMVGHQKAIPESVNEAMRQSGLAHVLSISGAHLGMAAGIFFFLVRFVFALIPSLALRHDSKKLAAIIALLGAFAYLLLAGMPVPAVRSYVMVAMVLCAVLMDRMVTPLRSLALAALLILLYAPESILSPSFQLSFAATTGILAYYEHWRKRDFVPREAGDAPSWGERTARFFGAIIATSTVATLATTPFVLYHFDSFPTYSLLGNLLALPILSFWIMPLIVAALILLPFGLAGLVFPLLGMGIHVMIAMASGVASLPFSTVSLPPLGTAAIAVIALSGLWICLWQQRWRWLGLAGVALGLLSLFFYQPPDIVVSADGGKIALRLDDGQAVMLRGSRSGFMQEQWLRFLRVSQFLTFTEFSKLENSTLRCDPQACLFNKNGVRITILKELSLLQEECGEEQALIIMPQAPAPRGMKCRARIIGKWQAKDGGGFAIWLEDGKYKLRTVRETLGDRPWSFIPEHKFGSPAAPAGSAHPIRP